MNELGVNRRYTPMCGQKNVIRPLFPGNRVRIVTVDDRQLFTIPLFVLHFLHQVLPVLVIVLSISFGDSSCKLTLKYDHNDYIFHDT